MTKWPDLEILEARSHLLLCKFSDRSIMSGVSACVCQFQLLARDTAEIALYVSDENSARMTCIRYIVNIHDIWHSIIQHPQDFPKPVITPINAVPVIAAEFSPS